MRSEVGFESKYRAAKRERVQQYSARLGLQCCEQCLKDSISNAVLERRLLPAPLVDEPVVSGGVPRAARQKKLLGARRWLLDHDAVKIGKLRQAKALG